jgi:hypothetical protein
MYAVALIGLRLSPRRTLSQWTAIDVAAAVAVTLLVGGSGSVGPGIDGDAARATSSSAGRAR